MEKGYYDDSVQVELHHGIDVSEDYQHEQVIVAQESKWQDVPFGIAFLVHLGITAIIFAVTAAKNDLPVYQGLVPSTTKDFVPLVLKAFAASAFAAAVLGYAALVIMRAIPTLVIHVVMIANLVILTAAAIVVGVKVAWWAGLIFLLFPLLWALIYWSMRPFIPFLAELLAAVANLVMKFPSTIGLNAVSVVLQFGWIMLYSWVTLALQARYGRGGVVALTVYLMLSFFWTLQMLQNIVHTTNCGVFATWYFMSNTSAMPSSPLPAALKRTMTTSFGSVAFGSLIVAIIQTLKTLAGFRARNTEGGSDCASVVLCVLAGIAQCILSVLESIAMYINHYAFVVVATYGQSYIQAGKTTLEMFTRTGFVNLLNDNMLDRLYFCVCTLNSAIICFAAAGFTKWMGLANNYVGMVCACSFFSAFLVTALIMQTIQSAAATIYVCFAEDSAALSRSNPALYEKIRSTFGGAIVAGGIPIDV